jgi:hypothetical protein
VLLPLPYSIRILELTRCDRLIIIMIMQSLLVAILEALKALAQAARANDDSGIGACIAECIFGCLASILEYFNKWAFVYVGVYGYSYLEAGKNVFTLFKNRGWEAIIADVRKSNACTFLFDKRIRSNSFSLFAFRTCKHLYTILMDLQESVLLFSHSVILFLRQSSQCPSIGFSDCWSNNGWDCDRFLCDDRLV